MKNEELIKKAIEAREKAYAPYSKFMVGAALLTKEGKVYQGCNIENIAFTPTNCAERTAFFKAISEGEYDFTAIAIVGGLKGKEISTYAAPCGVCRQVMLEFCDAENFKILIAKTPTDYKEYKLCEIIPEYFSPNNQKIGE